MSATYCTGGTRAAWIIDFLTGSGTARIGSVKNSPNVSVLLDLSHTNPLIGGGDRQPLLNGFLAGLHKLRGERRIATNVGIAKEQ